jgi:hypothetical protein
MTTVTTARHAAGSQLGGGGGGLESCQAAKKEEGLLKGKGGQTVSAGEGRKSSMVEPFEAGVGDPGVRRRTKGCR